MEQFLNGESNLYKIRNLSAKLKCYLNNLSYKSHLFIESSGTSNKRKIYALSKEALLTSATDVNNLLKISSSDRWICPLSHHHIGGLSILIRAHLSNSYVYNFNEKWSPSRFYKKIKEERSTLTSLVPTQLFDLINNNFSSPEQLRAVIVGGDKLPSVLAKRAIALGWPIYHTYGMTEFCSQIATSKYSQDGIELLPNAELKLINGLLAIKSKKMFTSITAEENGNFTTRPSEDFCNNDFYLTSDRAKLFDNKLFIYGRDDKLIKLKGHYLDISMVESELHNYLADIGQYGQASIAIEDDNRLGKKLILLYTPHLESSLDQLILDLENKFPILNGIIEKEISSSQKYKAPYEEK